MKQKGFTLIELLVVIAVIGILSSIVISSVNLVRSKAQKNAQIRKMQEIGKIFYQAKIESGQNLSDYTGSAPGGINVNTVFTNAGMSTSAYSQMMIDVWGRSMGLDVNEGEFGTTDCRADVIYSKGPDGVNDVWPAAQYDLLPRNDDFLLVIPPATDTCISTAQKKFEVKYN